MTLNDVSREDIHKTVSQIQEALHNHQQWHNGLMRSLTCGLPADRHDISQDAHRECRFGQWYYSNSPDKLRTHAGFQAMGEVHQRMHQLAREMILSVEEGKPVTPLDYDNFVNAMERLRLEILSLQRELEDSLLNHDTLTGAITRYSILPTLREQQEIVKRRAQCCLVVMIDLDDFKSVNDLYGHRAGDRVLSATAHYLIHHLRPYDKVFRYGGEEFLLCMPYTELKAGEKRLNELRAEIAALEIDIGDLPPLRVSASFGLTSLDPAAPVESSIERADKALYAAKHAGKNCVRVWEGAGY